MIYHAGPEDKPPGRPPNYAKEHPIRNALDNLAALVFAGVIAFSIISFLIWFLVLQFIP